MRRWRPRPLPALGRRGHLLLTICVGLGLALWVIWQINSRITPVLIELATAQADVQVNTMVTQVVESTLWAEDVSYDKMVTLSKNTDGQITAITSNTAQLNRLRTQVLSQVLTQLEQLQMTPIQIPLGNLTNINLISGLGPTVEANLLSTGVGEAVFEDDFLSAGVNQTLHRIRLRITVTVRILLPSGTQQVEVTSQVPVAETIIVGTVPQSYFVIEKSTS